MAGEKPFITSKVQSLGPGSIGWGNHIPVETAYPEGSLRRSTELSLEQLGVETIDLMQLHQYWPQWDKKDYWMEGVLRLKEDSDPELVEGLFDGDHAGKYEISQLLYLRPELIDFTQCDRQHEACSGGRLALGENALEATAAYGEHIMHTCLQALSMYYGSGM